MSGENQAQTNKDGSPRTRRRPDWCYSQAGCVPVRTTDANVEILLITSRGSGKWGIPKGVIDRGETARTAAEKEAMQEAGVKGKAEGSLGSYEYEKWGGTCVVEVFYFKTEEIMDVYPEMRQRKRLWCSPGEAILKVRSQSLAAIIRKAFIQ